MYKHHSYNNLVEKKLTQLPAPDAEGLWSGMEAILDKQLPQKKRRPCLLGWLFAHKAWLVASLFVGAAAASTLVYWPGADSPVAQRTPVTVPAKEMAATPAPGASSAAARTDDAAAPGQEVATTLSAAPDPSATTTDHTTQNTINPQATLTTTAARSSSEVRSSVNHTNVANSGTANNPAASASSATAPAAENRAAAPNTAAGDDAVIQWAATTSAIALPQASTLGVDPSAVKVNTEGLDNLSQQAASAAAAAGQMGRLPQEKGPYVGVVVGLDMSSVEFGSVKTGNNKGLLVGYAFNNRWSVESGLLWNKKQFSADGSYYKADGYVPQAGLTILDVNSTSQLYELPLNVKYTILTGRNQLFATAGVSSYLIKRENIDLHYDWNGQQGNQYYDYSNTSKHWLSVANLSVGYTVPVGSFGSLRLEPYVKMPLKELGVCNMRVTSMGLNVGLTKMLRR